MLYIVSVPSSDLTPQPPPPQASVSLPLDPNGGGGINTCLRVRGWGDPVPTKGQTLWYSVYSVPTHHLPPSLSLSFLNVAGRTSLGI